MRWIGWPLLLAAVMAVLFVLFPGLDRVPAGWFFDPALGFAAGKQGGWRFLYELVPWLVRAGGVWLLVVMVWGFWKKKALWGLDRRAALYVLLALALGPGAVVHGVFKENWGRARPHQTAEFGGQKAFSMAWVVSDGCESNCSFVSGHAAAGFAPLLVGFVTIRRRKVWLAGGVLFGLAVGAARMAAGGHFLSDVIFAGWVVYFVGLAVFWGMYRRWP